MKIRNPKSEIRNGNRARSSTVALIIALFACTVFAQPQQSEHFRISKAVLDAGGTASASASFHLVSAFGQPSPLGFQSSPNFRLSGGFLSPTFGVSLLSPIQQLVIQQLSPDVRLAWPRVVGASSYNVYRSANPLFSPTPATMLGTASDTTFTDANAVGLPAVRNYYLVTALSSNGTVLDMRGQVSAASQSGKSDLRSPNQAKGQAHPAETNKQ